jgi:glucose/arabinose dehydrogenase
MGIEAGDGHAAATSAVSAAVRGLGALLLAALLAGCASGSDDRADETTAPPPATTAPATTTLRESRRTLEVTEVATGLETPWSLAWDPEGRLWFTERPGRLTRLGGESRAIDGVVESGEGGLMGLEFDAQGRAYVMYTAAGENRIVRLAADGSQTVLVDAIAAAPIHDGGRLRFGPNGMLYASTGDAGDGALAQDAGSLNGKILEIDPDSGDVRIFSTGRRNAQGLCFEPGGRLLATEHGPDVGDEVNVLTEGSDGGWPETAGNGIRNYTPTIAPAGCAVYAAELIPQWQGSMLFVTLKDASLRRLTFGDDGSVEDEEVLYRNEFGRLRDVAVGPDGAVYLATSNRDGRGDPGERDDRILRIAPEG